MGSLLEALGLTGPKVASALPSAAATPAATTADITPAAKARYDAAAVAVDADVAAAVAVLTSHADALTAAAGKAFTDARQAVKESTGAGYWAQAMSRLPALQAQAKSMVAAEADQAAFAAARTTLRDSADFIAARSMVNESGVPDAAAKGFNDTALAVQKAASEKRWKDAMALLPAVRAAIPAVLKVRIEGKAYYDAFAAAAADIGRGRNAFYDIDATADDLAGERQFWSEADGRRVDAVRARKWAAAKAAVEPERRASVELADALATIKLEKVPFDAAMAALRNLDIARDAAIGGTKKVRQGEGRAFLARYEAMNDARNQGRFADALAALPALQAAIDALLAAAKAAFDGRLGFDIELRSLGDLGPARALVAAPPAPLAAAAAEWQKADAAVTSAAAGEDWDAAKAAVAPLREAHRKLLEAQGQFNKAAGPADNDAFSGKMLALKPRIEKAAEAGQPGHVEVLQKDVRQRVAAIGSALKGRDMAAAEAAFPAVEPALAAMEKAKADHASFRTRYETARDGEVAKARALALQPAELAADRDTALDKDEKAIVGLGDDGKLAAAGARIDRWLLQAGAWAGSKAVYDTLMAKKPDDAKLKKLAGTPGGAAVLDSIVAHLPPATSQRVMSSALLARFGFKVQSLDKANTDADNMAGVKAVDATKADTSLQKIYEVLSQTPIDVKGKVTDVIDFKQDTGGAMYDNHKKIYMYCGRPDDPEAGKQEFSVAGVIVPEGEEVVETCKPQDTQPAPYFDFALLHESGHAEDDARKFMEKHLGKDNVEFGGWVVHKQSPAVAAKAAAAHFRYSEAYVLATLSAAKSVPPAKKPAPPPGRNADEWEAARKAVLEWCRLVRVDQELWNKAGLSKRLAIDGRVYQEAYANWWVSYAYAARAKGITGYQFRSEAEWFAELYAAFFSEKLKPEHPSAAWLGTFKKPQPA